MPFKLELAAPEYKNLLARWSICRIKVIYFLFFFKCSIQAALQPFIRELSKHGGLSLHVSNHRNDSKKQGETASVKTTSLLAKWEKKPGLTAFRCSALPIQQSHFPLTMSQLCLRRWVFSFLHCTACKEVIGFQMFKNRNETPKCFHSLP